MRINDGSRPSKLAMARVLTGETSGDTSRDAVDVSFLDAVEAERARVDPFDFEILRARAHRLEEAPPTRPARSRLWWFVPVLALAAALFLVVRPPPNRLKGDTDLGFYVLRGAQVYPGDPDATFREGDHLQFTYRAGLNEALVLLSVDGDGRLSVFYPEQGDRPVPIVPGDRHVLDGSVILDDAPGPEVFVAFFGERWDVPAASDLAGDTFAAGGVEALQLLSERDPDIAVLVLDKR